MEQLRAFIVYEEVRTPGALITTRVARSLNFAGSEQAAVEMAAAAMGKSHGKLSAMHAEQADVADVQRVTMVAQTFFLYQLTTALPAIQKITDAMLVAAHQENLHGRRL